MWLILRLSGPATVGISAHSVQMLINAVFVAGLGSEAVAAVAVLQPLTLVIAALGYGIGIGAASLVSRHLGRGDSEAAGAAAAVAMVCVVPVGILATMVLLLGLDHALAAAGASAATAVVAHRFAILSILGTAVMLVHIVGGFVVRAEGRATFSMIVMVGSFGLNILLDAVFILWLGTGLEGAGWALLLSQTAAALACAAYSAAERSVLGRHWPVRRAWGPVVRQIVSLGFPVTAMTILSSVSLVLLLGAAARGGDEAVAGLGIGLRAITIGILPVLGLCTGAQAVFGYAFGAGDTARLRRALVIVGGLACLYGLTWSTGAILFAAPLLAPLSPDAATLSPAVKASDVLHGLLIPSSVAAVVLAYLQSIGAVRRAALLSTASQGFLLIPALLLLPERWGLMHLNAGDPPLTRCLAQPWGAGRVTRSGCITVDAWSKFRTLSASSFLLRARPIRG